MKRRSPGRPCPWHSHSLPKRSHERAFEGYPRGAHGKVIGAIVRCLSEKVFSKPSLPLPFSFLPRRRRAKAMSRYGTAGGDAATAPAWPQYLSAAPARAGRGSAFVLLLLYYDPTFKPGALKLSDTKVFEYSIRALGICPLITAFLSRGAGRMQDWPLPSLQHWQREREFLEGKALAFLSRTLLAVANHRTTPSRNDQRFVFQRTLIDAHFRRALRSLYPDLKHSLPHKKVTDHDGTCA